MSISSLYLFPIVLLIFGVEVDAWWINEGTIETQLPVDVIASKGRLIILDVNGVLLQNFSRPPTPLEYGAHVQKAYRGLLVHVRRGVHCVVRPDAEEFLLKLRAKSSIMIWSCCKKEKLIQILNACFPKIMNIANFWTGKGCKKLVI